MSLTTAVLGVQWAWANAQGWPGVFSPSAHAPNAGGNAFVRFDQETRIRGVAWQSSVKCRNHEVLLVCLISPEGRNLGEPGEQVVLTAHHVGELPSIVTHDLVFAGDDHLRVPAGSLIWVRGDGGGAPHGAPVEIQTTFYVG